MWELIGKWAVFGPVLVAGFAASIGSFLGACSLLKSAVKDRQVSGLLIALLGFVLAAVVAFWNYLFTGKVFTGTWGF